jgi:hypothetical protein
MRSIACDAQDEEGGAMRVGIAALLVVLFAGYWNDANAKCAFHVPCRTIHVTVLRCEYDAEATVRGRQYSEEYEIKIRAEPKTKWNEEILADLLESRRTRPFSFTVIAKIERMLPNQCPNVYSGYATLFDVFRVHRSMQLMKEELADSLGGTRLFWFSGPTLFECANLARARELTVFMNESWCEWSANDKDDLTRFPFANIQSYR